MNTITLAYEKAMSRIATDARDREYLYRDLGRPVAAGLYHTDVRAYTQGFWVAHSIGQYLKGGA